MARSILIDGRRAQGRPAGVGHYTRSIVVNWPDVERTSLLVDERRPDADFGGMPVIRLKGGVRWNLRAALLAVRTRSLFFSPENFLVPLLLGRRALVTVHDLTSIDLPHAQTRRNVFSVRYLLPLTLRRAGAVVVPTRAVLDDLRRHFPWAVAKAHVISEGTRELGRMAHDPEAKAAVAGLTPYLLYVGTIEPRKNVLTLIEAFLDAAPAEWNLVLVGQVGWIDDDDRRRLDRLVADPRIHHLGYVPDSWLGPVFSGARLFAYVSESEGFGLPVAEAMAAGIPVIHTDDPALMEVGGGAGLVVARADLSAELRKAIARGTSLDAGQRREMIARGPAASARYDWATAAASTHDLLLSLARPGERRSSS